MSYRVDVRKVWVSHTYVRSTIMGAVLLIVKYWVRGYQTRLSVVTY